MPNFPRMRHFLICGLFLTGWIGAQTLIRPDDYFQQEVAYRIEVALNDSDHTLSAFLSLDYTNHSPDTLEFVWFHLWPNAYKNNETAFAREKFEQGSTKFYFSKEKDRGYIDSLDFRSGETTLEWEYHPEWIDVAKVHLARSLPPGGTVTIETPFFVKIPGAFSRMRHTGNHYEISQWYPKPAVYDREGWHAMPYQELGEFYSEFGTFDVRITLPAEYVVMATGDLPEGDPEYAFLDSLATVTAEYYALKKDDDKPDKKARKKWLKKFKKWEFAKPGKGPVKTLHFHQERVHDFAWFADKRYMVQKGTLWVEDSTRAITLWALHLPKFAELWEESIEYIHDATYWFGRWYGTYPYNHVTAATSEEIAGYAMEYPNITIVSISGTKELLEVVIMHEVGHNWHYGIFGFNEREHTWLDEGYTAYSEVRYWDAKYEEENGGLFSYVFPPRLNRILKNPFTMRSLSQTLANIVVGSHDDVALASDFTAGSLTSYALAIQFKSIAVFDFLERYLGAERNQAVWDEFARTWSFAHPGPEDVRTAFETVAGEDLSWFFDDMIRTTKRLDYGVNRLTRSGEGVEVAVTNYGDLNAPVEVATLDRDGQVLESRWLPGFTGERTVSFASDGVHSATTDPGAVSTDVDRSNDHLPLMRLGKTYLQKPALRFLFSAPETGRSQLFYIPMLYGTAYSGALPGVVFYSGVLPPIKNVLSGSLFYSLEKQRLAGGFGVAVNRYRLGAVDQLTGRLRYADYPDYRVVQLGVDAIFRERAVSSPALSAGLELARQNLTPDALDSTFWDTGAFTHATLNARYWDESHALLRWELSGRLRAINGEAESLQPQRQAVTLQTMVKASYRFSRKVRLYTRGWLGHTFADSQDRIPDQYRFWLSGGLDNDFRNPLVINRTGEGALAAYNSFFIPDEGPGLRAITTDVPGATAWALNLDLTSKYPLALFADIAGTNNGADESWQTYWDTGIILSLGPIEFIVPLWHSWEAKDGQQPYEGWRIGLSLPSISL